MILGYKKLVGNEDSYWFGRVQNHDRKFIRCAVGLSMPILDRAQGAVVVVAELYRLTGPQDLWIIAMEVGDWSDVRAGLTQFRRDLKYGIVICDCEEARPLVRRMKEVYYGLSEIPIYTDVKPEYALTEVGRSTVDEMFQEGRLHAEEHMIDRLDEEPIARALQSVVCHLRDWPAIYATNRERQGGFGNILGIEGL